MPIFVQAFDTRNFGTGKTLTPSGSVIDGNGGVNYTYDFIEDTNGEIDRLAITVSAVTDTKTFDGTTGSIGVPTIAPR